MDRVEGETIARRMTQSRSEIPSFDVVVQVVRRSDGERRLVSISGVERHGRAWHLVPRPSVEARCAAGAPA